jgi:hypothetical protein
MKSNEDEYPKLSGTYKYLQSRKEQIQKEQMACLNTSLRLKIKKTIRVGHLSGGSSQIKSHSFRNLLTIKG